MDNNTDSSFNTFWAIFKALYDEHFPLMTVKFNINKHKLNGYMTNELLEARSMKAKLHKLYLSSKTEINKANYIQYRNTYNYMLRNSKQKYYAEISIKILIILSVPGNCLRKQQI